MNSLIYFWTHLRVSSLFIGRWCNLSHSSLPFLHLPELRLDFIERLLIILLRPPFRHLVTSTP